MYNITYPNTNLYYTNGNTGSIISSSYINTPIINTKSIQTLSGTGSVGNVLYSNGSTIFWSPKTNNITTTLNMSTNNIMNTNNIVCNTLNTSTISNTTFTNQTTFFNRPISSNSINLSDLVTKEYVDNNILSSGIYHLYLNKSQYETVPPGGNTGYFKLSTTPSGTTGQGITGTTVTTGNILVGSFMSEPLNITTIPPSLCILNLYIGLNSAINIFYTYFELIKYSNGVSTTIGISTLSSNSGDINVTPVGYPDLYKMAVTISSAVPLSLSDRLLIKLYYRTTVTPSTLFTIYFEQKYYSYLQIIVNKDINGSFHSTAASNLNMNNYNITSNGNMNIFSSSNLNLGSQTSIINIGTNTSTNTNINLGITGNGELATKVINFNCPLTPLYTTLPSNMQLGQVIIYPRIGGITNINNGSNIYRYNFPYAGRWIISATMGIYIKTVGVIISSLSFTLSSNNTLDMNIDGTQITTTTGYNNIMNTTGIVNTSDNYLGSLEFIVNYFIKFTGEVGSITSHNSDSDPYIVQAVRLG
jgi:hypothetical protein